MFKFRKKQEEPIISFVATMEGMLEVEEILPKKQTSFLPYWWRSIPKYNANDGNKPTVKSCPSFTDYFSQGFVLPAWADMELYYKKENNAWSGKIATGNDHENQYFLENHPNSQFLDYVDASYMGKEAGVILKAVAPWRLITRPGWSVMQVPLFYHFDNQFAALPGIIDTDIEHEINLQMMLLNQDKDKTISIKRGQPLALFIPYKRSDLPTIDDLDIREMNDKDRKKLHAYYFWTTSKFPVSGAYRKRQIERDKKANSAK